jgi:hypothetical protein
MIMLNWLKNILRKWMLSDQVSNKLDCIITGPNFTAKRITCIVTGSVGMSLIGMPDGGTNRIVIQEYQAVDKDQFWALWRRYNRGKKWRWESGKKFEPRTRQ